MKTYRVKVMVIFRTLEFYKVQADSPEEAEELYALGASLGCDEEILDSKVISVKEERP